MAATAACSRRSELAGTEFQKSGHATKESWSRKGLSPPLRVLFCNRWSLHVWHCHTTMIAFSVAGHGCTSSRVNCLGVTFRVRIIKTLVSQQVLGGVSEVCVTVVIVLENSVHYSDPGSSPLSRLSISIPISLPSPWSASQATTRHAATHPRMMSAGHKTGIEN